MKKTKKLTALLLVMAMVLSLGACGGGDKKDNQGSGNGDAAQNKDAENSGGTSEDGGEATDKVANGEDVKVEILQYKVEIEEALEGAIEKYQKLYPNVTIKLETIGGNDSVDTMYKARAASGNMPDIFNCAGPVSCALYEPYLEDLSDQPWVQYANSGMLDLNTIDGKIYGMPVTTEGMGLIVNKEMFAAAGVDVATLDSFDKIEEAFNTLQTAIDNGDLKDTYPDLENVASVQGGASWVLGNHGINICLSPEFEEDVFACSKAEKVEFNYADAYQAYTELQLKYSAAKDDYKQALSVDYNTAVQELLATGKVACIQQGNWIYGDVKAIDQTIADSLVYIPAPIKGYKEDCIFSIVSNYWCVNKQSDDNVKEAAKHFLNWLYQSEEGKEIVVNKFGFTPVFNNYGDLKPSDPLTQNMVEYFEKGKGIPVVFQGCPDGEDYTMNVFGAKVQGVLSGSLTWDQVFEESKAEWEQRKG
ncbi:MAG: carbohydrate ABC transporter substrate-binding protein [Lachnospiraceae bacterium]|nr:carbohydrate ABC transporter substrate-binding protein [Lachnospiraceae bacterium]